VESVGNQEVTDVLVFDSFGPRSLDAATLVQVSGIIPDDRLKQRRLANLALARQVVLAREPGGQALGVAYVRSIFGVPNVTWIVAAEARRRRIGSRLVAEIQKHSTWLTAVCRTEPSVRLARGSGFRMIFGRFALWTALHGPARPSKHA